MDEQGWQYRPESCYCRHSEMKTLKITSMQKAGQLSFSLWTHVMGMRRLVLEDEAWVGVFWIMVIRRRTCRIL